MYKENIEYAYLLCQEKEMEKACQGTLCDELKNIRKKFFYIQKTLDKCKIDLEGLNIFNFYPEKLLMEFYEIKNRITNNILNNYSKPDNYDFLLKLSMFLLEIEDNNLVIDYSKVDKNILKRINYIKNINTVKNKISYNIFGSVTGRLTVNKGYFPILNLPKSLRSMVKPTNDIFVELDFNSSEIRTLLSLLDVEQPQEDIHEWNVKNVYGNLITRKEAKERFFAWLYNPNSEDHLSSKFYSKEKVLEKYYKDGIIKTPFGRSIQSENWTALNYIVQSTASDLFLTQAMKLHECLKSCNSFIAFLVHDSLVIDTNYDDLEEIKNCIASFKNTSLGNYKINVEIGKDYGSLVKVEE